MAKKGKAPAKPAEKKPVKKAKRTDAWKNHERKFCAYFNKALGRDDIRRNDAKFNAGDKERNSDVNVKDERLAVSIREENGKVTKFEGITSELKYRSNEFSTIYDAMKTIDKLSSKKHTIMILNDKFMFFWLDSFIDVWNWFVKGKVVAGKAINHFSIMHRSMKYNFKTIEEAIKQSSRYSVEWKLLPCVCIRKKGAEALVVISTGMLKGRWKYS